MATPQQQIEELRKQLAIAQKRASEAELRASEAEEKATKALRENASLKANRDIRTLIRQATARLGTFILKKIESQPDLITKEDIEQILKIVDDTSLRAPSTLEYTDFHKYLSNWHSEKSVYNLGRPLDDQKSKEDAKAEAEEEASEKAADATQEAGNSITRSIDLLDKAIRTVDSELKLSSNDPTVIKAGETDSAVRAGTNILNFPEPEALDKEKKKSRGRLAVNLKDTDRRIKGIPSDTQCPHCKHTGMVQKDSLIKKLRDAKESLSGFIELISAEFPLMYCPFCRTHHIKHPEGVSPPVSPGSTVGQSLVIEAAHMHVRHSVSLNKVGTLLGRCYVMLSHNTLPANVHRLAMFGGLKELLFQILMECKAANKNLVIDETPFPVNQMMGKSKVSTEETSSPYLLSWTSSPYSERPFTMYMLMKDRSGESIVETMKGWAPSCIVTDGYKGYIKLLKELKLDFTKRRQVCLVHWRRKLLAALNIKALEAVALTDDGVRIAAQEIIQGNANYLLSQVAYAMRLIYAYESRLVLQEGESIEQYEARVSESRNKYARPLMDNIDEIMKRLAVDHAGQKKENGRYSKKDGGAFCESVVYYMNNRDNMRVFLDNPGISPDSNAVERGIRPIACMKHSSYFKQSAKYTESYCIWLSLFMTAEQNGIKNPVAWLKKFCRAYYEHCFDATLNQRFAEGKMDLGFTEFKEDANVNFDYSKWLPWTYANSPENDAIDVEATSVD